MNQSQFGGMLERARAGIAAIRGVISTAGARIADASVAIFAPAAVETPPTTLREAVAVVRWTRAGPALGAAAALAVLGVMLWPQGGIRAHPPELPSAAQIERARQAVETFDPHGGDVMNRRRAGPPAPGTHQTGGDLP